MMKEHFFEILLTKGKFRKHFSVDIEKHIFSEERVIFRKNQIEKVKKKTKQKREEQLKGFHWKRWKRKSKKSTENKRNNIEKKKEDDLQKGRLGKNHKKKDIKIECPKRDLDTTWFFKKKKGCLSKTNNSKKWYFWEVHFL